MATDLEMRVAVIGTGVAGLCCLRHLTRYPEYFKVQAFEQTNQIGGTWVYTDKIGQDEETGLPIHSSMYKNLKTNLPKQVMCYPGFPFDSSLPSFVHHSDVLHYLEQYTEHYQLYQYIQFYSQVKRVTPSCSSPMNVINHRNGYLNPFGVTNGTCWEVDIKHVHSDDEKKKFFDVVLVCNGHFFVPHYNVRGLEHFKGTVLHSHEYRLPDPFEGQCVLVVGAGQSGIDICLEVATKARTVLVSHRKGHITSPLPGNIYEVKGITFISETGSIQLDDGDTVKEKVDSIILCTGYEYEFPFLTPECGIQVTNNRVHPLYKHIVNIVHPSMAFIGLNFTVVPPVCCDVQVQYYLSVLLGRTKLPSQEEMKEEEEEMFCIQVEKGIKERHTHLLGDNQWSYYNELAELGQFEPLKPVIQSLYDEVKIYRSLDVARYKDLNYDVIDDKHWCKK